jgi:hypothetical protein
VEDLWLLFEPERVRRFPVLERALLKSARRKATPNAVAVPDLERIGFTNAEAIEWSTFFGTAAPSALVAATKQSSIDDPYCHLQIISRAALLLFVATTTARKLLTNAAYSVDVLSFWWQSHGEDRCLWPRGDFPADPLDLWADVPASIDDSINWRAENPPAASSLRDWRRTNPSALDHFGGLELIGIWGLLP